MTRGRLVIGALVGALAVAGPAWAQRGKADAASRDPGTSVERTGTAVDRPSAGSDSTSGSSGSVGSSSSGSTRAVSYEPVSPSGSSGERFVAPVRPTERYEREQTRQRGEGGGERRPSGGASSEGARAVPRGTDSVAAPSGGGRTRGASGSAGADDGSPGSRGVPTYSRPRDGQPATGAAVDRRYPRPGGAGGYYGGYNTYFPSLYYNRYYLPGYAFGLGYYYDPLFYDPYAYGAYGYGGYGSGYYGGGYGAGSSGRGSYSQGPTGSLRLKIKPRDAQVYVDGYFVGDVDQFDGIFQRLTLDAGSHRIEIRAAGRKTIEFDVLIAPGETVTYKGELQ